MAEARVIRPADFSEGTAQTPGMRRLEAVSGAMVGAKNLWAGHVTMQAGAKSGAHHHGECESVIYLLSGRVQVRYGDKLEHSFEARGGDFIYIPPHLIHQEVNASEDESVESVVIRDRQEAIVVNVDVAS